MKKILVPLDASEHSKRALNQAKELAEAFGSQIVLLYVVSVRISTYWYNPTIPEPEIMFSILEEEKAHAEDLLVQSKEAFGPMKDRVETMILQGSVADEIIEYINTSDVDFVVMGSHGIGSGIHRNLLGSVTNKVLHYGEKPILVVR